MRGPTSDLIPSSSVFEMYPLGFVTIASHLEAHGYPVRIINLAARMLRDPAFDADALIAWLPHPLVFGIDLHWLPHAQSAQEKRELQLPAAHSFRWLRRLVFLLRTGYGSVGCPARSTGSCIQACSPDAPLPAKADTRSNRGDTL